MIRTDCFGIEAFRASPDPEAAAKAWDRLQAGEFAGYDGWLRIPAEYDETMDRTLREIAGRIRESSDALVVLGVGGSYLGARALLEALRSPDYNLRGRTEPEIFFAGNSLSASELGGIAELVADRDFSVNVISKSGSTLETAAAFRVFYDLLQRKYGDEGARARVVVTTDPNRGALRAFARENGMTALDIPSDIGGRFSVLTPVGLLPLVAAGEDPARFIEGAARQLERGTEEALRYAAARRSLYDLGKRIELCAFFEPRYRSLGEWWKQLFGESECKGGRGIFPATAIYTTDLHSLGQCVQDGERNLFETFVSLPTGHSLALPEGGCPGDGLDRLAGRDLAELEAGTQAAVRDAHAAGGVPVLSLEAEPLSPETLGGLVMFFETACAVSVMLLGAHPFDQPGVEAYKRNLRTTLGL